MESCTTYFYFSDFFTVPVFMQRASPLSKCRIHCLELDISARRSSMSFFRPTATVLKVSEVCDSACVYCEHTCLCMQSEIQDYFIISLEKLKHGWTLTIHVLCIHVCMHCRVYKCAFIHEYMHVCVGGVVVVVVVVDRVYWWEKGRRRGERGMDRFEQAEFGSIFTRNCSY